MAGAGVSGCAVRSSPLGSGSRTGHSTAMAHDGLGWQHSMLCALGATALIALAWAGPTWACSGPAEYVSPTGSDAANDCTNAATPCATIAHAVAVACAGSTINVRPGTYNESASI